VIRIAEADENGKITEIFIDDLYAQAQLLLLGLIGTHGRGVVSLGTQRLCRGDYFLQHKVTFRLHLIVQTAFCTCIDCSAVVPSVSLKSFRILIF
jgi:hypothetical protein